MRRIRLAFARVPPLGDNLWHVVAWWHAAAIMLFVAGCAAIPKVELTAYATAYSDVEVITNDVLDIVVPYERVVLRRNAPAVARVIRTRCVLGEAPFCYETRDAYADIGDPPLVGAYRRLSKVVLRFNKVLVAYAEGISGRLLQQELDGLTSAVTELGNTLPLSFQAATFTTNFSDVVAELLPIASFATGFADRAQLRAFLLQNHHLVDRAILLMARNSGILYSNVVVGTALFPADPAIKKSLRERQRQIRRIIANWTVLLDDTRDLLRELKLALEAPDGLETRIRNLEPAVTVRIDTTVIKKQIATLGTPALSP